MRYAFRSVSFVSSMHCLEPWGLKVKGNQLVIFCVNRWVIMIAFQKHNGRQSLHLAYIKRPFFIDNFERLLRSFNKDLRGLANGFSLYSSSSLVKSPVEARGSFAPSRPLLASTNVAATLLIGPCNWNCWGPQSGTSFVELCFLSFP